MYNMSISIPFVDAATLEAIEAVAPNLERLTGVIPLTDTQPKARRVAYDYIMSILNKPEHRYEHVSSVESFKLAEDGKSWVGSYIIAGD